MSILILKKSHAQIYLNCNLNVVYKAQLGILTNCVCKSPFVRLYSKSEPDIVPRAIRSKFSTASATCDLRFFFFFFGLSYNTKI